MRTRCFMLFGVALKSLLVMGQEEIASSLVPTDDGHGVVACVSVGFSDFRELPVKATEAVLSLVVCVTQPVHPYHYIRDDRTKVIPDGRGNNKKVWLPFYRLWGKHQGDSVLGIVHDSRSMNGIGGTHWFAGYGNDGWKDKSGKLVGVLLLTWGMAEALDHEGTRYGDLGPTEEPTGTVSSEDSHWQAAEGDSEDRPEPEPEPAPPTLPEGWDGEGGPVGR